MTSTGPGTVSSYLSSVFLFSRCEVLHRYLLEELTFKINPGMISASKRSVQGEKKKKKDPRQMIERASEVLGTEQIGWRINFSSATR